MTAQVMPSNDFAEADVAFIHTFKIYWSSETWSPRCGDSEGAWHRKPLTLWPREFSVGEGSQECIASKAESKTSVTSHLQTSSPSPSVIFPSLFYNDLKVSYCPGLSATEPVSQKAVFIFNDTFDLASSILKMCALL